MTAPGCTGNRMSKRFSDPQKEFIARIEKSIERVRPMYSQARMLRLYLLERELLHVFEGLTRALDYQRRAYSDDALTSKEPLLITGIDKSR
jgi:hypothetical protein